MELLSGMCRVLCCLFRVCVCLVDTSSTVITLLRKRELVALFFLWFGLC